MDIKEFLSKLEKVKKYGNGYTACCPAHKDKNPSLSIKEEDGKILLHCFAGCETEKICNALGITTRDLRTETQSTYKPIEHKKKLDRTHIYCDVDGNAIAVKDIYRSPNGTKSAIWSRCEYKNGNVIKKTSLKGLNVPLYNINKVKDEPDTVYIVEGEKDADTLNKMDLTATTAPNHKWKDEYNTYLKGKNIVVIKDIDEAGERYANETINGVLPIAKTVKKIDPATMCESLPDNGDISDVVEKLGTDKAKQALEKAVSVASIITQKLGNVNTASKTSKIKIERFTPEVLIAYFEENKISIRKNEITKVIDIKGFENENREDLPTNIVPLIYFSLSGEYKSCTKDNVADAINLIASNNTYNPVLDYLNSFEWDGKDHLQKLYKVMKLPEDDILSRSLIKKWLCQCIALLNNNTENPFGGEGVLVLQGKQAVGKTSLFRKLSLANDNHPEFFKEGVCVDFRDKDTYIRALSCWIAELGEIESTFKSDVERLKAFITQSVDEYRRPYGRGDERRLRRTSLCGSCNSTEYLIDETGNRRFWTVPILEKMDYNEIQKLDVIQIWKQIQRLVSEDISCFRLNSEELQALALRNSTHEKKLKGQQEIEDILSWQSGNGWVVTLEYMTVTDFKTLYSDELRQYSAAQIGKVLDKLGYKTEQKRLNGSMYPSKVKLLPRRKHLY